MKRALLATCVVAFLACSAVAQQDQRETVTAAVFFNLSNGTAPGWSVHAGALALPVGDGQEALVSSSSFPGCLHVIKVEFEDQKQADKFVPALCFCPEVADDVTFEHNAMATRGLPELSLVPILDVSVTPFSPSSIPQYARRLAYRSIDSSACAGAAAGKVIVL